MRNSCIEEQTVTLLNGEKVTISPNGTWRPFGGAALDKNRKKNFRNTMWGMTKQQVREVETVQIEHETDDTLVFLSTIASLECLVGYIFTSTLLVRGKYVIKQQHSNSNDYIGDFVKLKDMLTTKYGEPLSDETIWKNVLYQDDSSEWGMAISAGHLVMYAEWDTDDTTIFLGLNGDNYETSLEVEYSSKELKEVEKNNKLAEDLADL